MKWIYLLATLCLSAGTVSSFNAERGNCIQRFNSRIFKEHQRELHMYMPSQSPTPPRKSISNPGSSSRTSDFRKTSPLSLSPSVLSSCDTLPSFQTAHGLLSPETVMRLDKMTAKGGRSKALDLFLTTYRRKGPMSCLEMLSDPDILPDLTSAMRDLC
mmetsp:Transcript_6294/g.9262  ORF Transcript_6294/g.9262 Transcript_6294/m.9262 type:complete len:158 (+) Transcript_6294:335-808(+)